MLHFGKYHINATIQNYYKTAFDVVRGNLHSNTDSVASGQIRIKRHLFAKFA